MNAGKIICSKHINLKPMFNTSVLQEFSPISLQFLESYNLLDRFDAKYLFPICKIEDILQLMKNDYSVLEIDEHRIFCYDNIYFDTEDFRLYHEHHNGKSNRYKVRYRQYVDSGITFFEMKKKDNKNKTLKERLQKPYFEYPINGGAEKLIAQNLNLEPTDLHEKLRIYYNRITLVNNNDQEKVTFDFNLTFESEGKIKSINDIVIAESKISKMNSKTIFNNYAKSEKLLSLSLSKYCFGLNILDFGLKYNIFKELVLKVNKVRDQRITK